MLSGSQQIKTNPKITKTQNPTKSKLKLASCHLQRTDLSVFLNLKAMEISALSLSPYVPTRPSSLLQLSSSKSSFFNPNSCSSLSIRKRTTSSLALNSSRTKRNLSCTCLFGLGVPELVVIAGVAVLLFGPKQLPEVGRSIGKTVKSFQQAAKEFETELKKEPDSPTPPGAIPTSTNEDDKQDIKASNSEESS